MASPLHAVTPAAAGAATRIDLATYDYIIVAFSGGRDSVACVLDLLERGAPKERMELWHHDIVRPESRPTHCLAMT